MKADNNKSKKYACAQYSRIQKGVIKPREPKEKGTIGGTGPLNIDAACTFSTPWINNQNHRAN